MNAKKEEQLLELETQDKDNVKPGVICPPASLNEEQAWGKLERYRTIFRCGYTAIKE